MKRDDPIGQGQRLEECRPPRRVEQVLVHVRSGERDDGRNRERLGRLDRECPRNRRMKSVQHVRPGRRQQRARLFRRVPIERTHLNGNTPVRETGRNPVEDFATIMGELASFSDELASKPMFVVASKMDAAQEPERVEALRNIARERDLPFFEISSATGQGIEELKFAMGAKVLN